MIGVEEKRDVQVDGRRGAETKEEKAKKEKLYARSGLGHIWNTEIKGWRSNRGRGGSMVEMCF